MRSQDKRLIILSLLMPKYVGSPQESQMQKTAM